MKIYMDNCCYNRLFDDRSNIKNYLEREAVLLVLELIHALYQYCVLESVFANSEVLLRELGPVGMIRYLEQYDNGGTGDYTKEKYSMPEMTIEQIMEM